MNVRNLNSVGDRLRAALSAAGETQGSLADKLGIKQNTVSAWITNRADLPGQRLAAVADILGVSMDFLYGRETPTMTVLNPRERAYLEIGRALYTMTPEEAAGRLSDRVEAATLISQD